MGGQSITEYHAHTLSHVLSCFQGSQSCKLAMLSSAQPCHYYYKTCAQNLNKYGFTIFESIRIWNLSYNLRVTISKGIIKYGSHGLASWESWLCQQSLHKILSHNWDQAFNLLVISGIPPGKALSNGQIPTNIEEWLL